MVEFGVKINLFFLELCTNKKLQNRTPKEINKLNQLKIKIRVQILVPVYIHLVKKELPCKNLSCS